MEDESNEATRGSGALNIIKANVNYPTWHLDLKPHFHVQVPKYILMLSLQHTLLVT